MSCHLQLFDGDRHAEVYEKVSRLLAPCSGEKLAIVARDLFVASANARDSWLQGYCAAKWMLEERLDSSLALMPLSLKRYNCYFSASNLVYNISQLRLPPWFRVRLYAAALYSAGKTLDSCLLEDVLFRSSTVAVDLDEMDCFASDPTSNQSVRRLSHDLARINACMQLGRFSDSYAIAELALKEVPSIPFFEAHHSGAVGIVVMQSLIKFWSILFAEAMISRDLKKISLAHAKINRCNLAMLRCWKGRIRKRRELPYAVEGLVPAQLLFIARQAFALAGQADCDDKVVAWVAFTLYFFVFRPEGPRERVRIVEGLIRSYVSKRTGVACESISGDLIGFILSRREDDFQTAY